ncbi:RND superfamily putative drug exporter [Kribbella sp. VKM Ac-2527]|uniref:RND superfamily putative drug exporter n=1 Tax=Kribbella caucasensis TaxID=2512215 RepID=A0A4R6KJL6_9ACTN|nr:MMPL family transporter [Kribbella sp. VKM Ac-2527]TDO51313.1 RND superfamily putative drug exporter [Kribbella sp. VKM Ac-2527]
MSKALYRLGRYAARRPWAVIGTWLVVSVLLVAASGAFGQKLHDTFEAPGVDSQHATDLLSAARSDQAGLTTQVVATPRDDQVTFPNSAEARAALARVQTAAGELPHVLAADEGAISPDDGRVAVIRIHYPVLEELEPADLENLKEFGVQAGTGSPLRIELSGDIFFAFEEPDAGVGELVGVIAAIIILLVAFGSLIATGLPIGLALFGLALGISSMSLITYLIEIPAWAPVLGSMVGLGVGIDYALILVTRHREYLAGGLTVEESVGRAVATAGRSVVFAGGTVVIAILGLAVAGIPFLTAGGIAVSTVVLIMVIAAITLLPAFLGLAGHRINRRRKHAPGLGWQRWAEYVSRHAAAFAIGATVLLLALAAPVLALRVGTPDEGTLPTNRTERRAYDLVAEGFGPGVNGPLVIAVDISKDPSVVQPLLDAVKADKGIAAVAPPSVQAGVATLVAYPTTGPQDDATVDTIHRLRAEVFPPVLGDSPAKAHVGGQTASLADVGDRVSDRLPWFIGAVILLSLILLTVVFRSILVPLKAALLNLLSIGASFGVLVMVFQWGWAAGLIGLETTVPIIPFIPMFMFALLFGLSMDYEVFLLSRIREEYLSTGDNGASVVRGIAATGRVITSAALIMISVFLSFVVSDDPSTKMFGLGLALAVFIDATIVRLVLVPAVMKLLGDANWWIPQWLDRLLPTMAGEPEPAVEIKPVADEEAAALV